ncbi:MAG: thioredoxin domain-containing protein, partial [Bdellovibrionales bacterium]
MKTVILSTSLGLLIGAGVVFFMNRPTTQDISQSLVSELSDNTVVAEYTGGKILAGDLKEQIHPQFEKARSELLQQYLRAAENELARRHADRLNQEPEEVSEAELSLYMKANKIGLERKSEIENFLKLEKKRIQGQLNQIKLLQDLNFQNRLGAATFKIQNTAGMAEKGADNPKVVIQVFCDFGNPLCNRARLTMEALVNQYKETVKWVYRHYPVASNQIGDQASLVSFCALEQKKFWAVHDAFYNNQMQLTDEKMLSLAESAGLNPEELQSCLQSDRPQKLLKEEKSVAEQMGLNSTPVFFINGQKVTDPEK